MFLMGYGMRLMFVKTLDFPRKHSIASPRIQNNIKRKETRASSKAYLLIKRFTIVLWRLATIDDYTTLCSRTISHLIAVWRSTYCTITNFNRSFNAEVDSIPIGQKKYKRLSTNQRFSTSKRGRGQMYTHTFAQTRNFEKYTNYSELVIL